MSDISSIDKNFAIETLGDLEVVFFSVRKAPFAVYGLESVSDGEPFHRIPQDVAAATSEYVTTLAYHTSGGRVRFKTDSPYIALRVKTERAWLMAHMTLAGAAGMDVYTKDEGGYHHRATCLTIGGNDGPNTIQKEGGYTNIVRFGTAEMRDVTVNLPLYGWVDELYIGVAPNATLAAGDAYRDIPPTAYYGSSITQGGCASRPGNNYSAMLSRRFDVDFRNFGLSGSARGEEAISDFVASQPMSAFVFAYDHNAPSVEHLAATHEPMYKNVRASHPDIPVIFITRPKTNYNEAEKMRREVVYKTYQDALGRGERVYFVDGEPILDILGGDSGTVDGVHPNDLGFACIAKALEPIFEEIYGR